MTEPAAHLQKAREKLEAARDLLKTDHAEDSISRTYYAAFHAATAALLAIGETAKTHRGTNALFWRHFVETGRLSRDVGSILPHAMQMRGKADYDVFNVFDTAAAADLLRDVEAFVEAVEPVVRELDADV